MRLYLPTVFTVFILLIVFSPNLTAQTTFSFGPEVSAEDYAQHVKVLSSLKTKNARKNYIAKQLMRLGLNGQNLVCHNVEQGIYAVLKSTKKNQPTTQYIAQLEDVYQTASVIEIAERFMTQSPRPNHDIRFSFFTTTQDNIIACSETIKARLNILPVGMEYLDKGSLVRELNALYLEGK